tara:strand:+ start:1071 stop:1406 length:336 start_codon:yes stop_codon:yes gene_type:complete
MIKDIAIRSVHANVVTIYDVDGDNPSAYDADGNEVVLDTAAVSAKVAELQAAEPWEKLRRQRNRTLTETDWTQVADVPVGIKTTYQSYRQALRDLPANTSDPANPVWPTKP